jgi:tyrosyl-tRNA synthetase
VTTLVHGADQVARAERASSLVFSEDIASLPVDEVIAVLGDVPSSDIAAADFADSGISIVDVLVRTGLAPSKGEARRLVQSGGVYVNNRRLSDVQGRVDRADAIGGAVILLRKGQRATHLVRVVA